MNNKELKKYLDNLYLKYENKHSAKDPVWTLHKFNDTKDIEISGLIISCYSYGRVEQINLFVNKFLKKIDFKVYEFTSNYSEHKDKKYLADLKYRFNSAEDFSLLIKNINFVIHRYGSLKNLFLENYDSGNKNILQTMNNFTKVLNTYTNKDSNHKYLIPLSENNSTCKRTNMFFRWMIRKDSIDTGIWAEADKSKLIMPVDTHIYKVSRTLKLVSRISSDMKFAIELTEKLKKFDARDPVKYDFALCHSEMEK